ncbi:MAG TPA: AI-2E family transporter [Usitatibacter sp.]|nr:AI-2E family transporter [Usitatibacter sp.]
MSPLPTAPPRFELTARAVAIALLALGCFFVLQAFLGAIIFAVILCFSTWPIFVKVRERLGGRSWLAALAMVLALLLAIAVPVALSAQALVTHSADAVEFVRGMLERKSTIELPAFVRGIPMVGPWIDDYFRMLMQGGTELVALLRHFAEPMKGFMIAIGGGIGAGLAQVLLAIFVSYFLYRDGDSARAMFLEGVHRLAGRERGGVLIATAMSAVRGVVYGLIGTAVVQAAVAFIGFAIAGVPGAFLLAALTFVVSLVPLGPPLIWGGAAAWLYFQGETGWSIFMVIYGIAVISSVDNVVKPILMSRAGNLSMLIVVLGVFGGALAFGFVGLFIGPALLAVAASLVKAWIGTPAPGPVQATNP